MGIENLLAQGVQIRPQGMEANALMQYQQFQQQQAQNALMNYQLSQAKRKDAADEQAALQLAQWRNALQMPQGQQEFVPGRPAMNAAQAESAAMTPGYGVSSAQDQWKTGAPDPRMVALTGAAKAGLVGPADFLKAAYPEQKIGHAPAGSMIFDERTGRQIAQVPDKVANDEFIARMKAAGIDPASPQGRALLHDKLVKDSTHQPAPSFNNYGSPLPIDLGGGKTGYIQPPTRPGGPTQVLQVPGTGGPAIKPAENKAPPVEFTKSIAGLNELTNGLASYEKTLTDEGGIGPLSTGEKRAKLQASYTSLQMGLKNAFELGALAGPDLGLLQGMLIDPTSPRAVLVGDKGVAAQIAKAREYVNNRTKAVYDAHKQPVPPELSTAPAASSGAPKAGDVVDGYRFKGGNPADKANWERK